MVRVYVTTVFNTVSIITGTAADVKRQIAEMGSTVLSVEDANRTTVTIKR